jgi:hypothetical protein
MDEHLIEKIKAIIAKGDRVELAQNKDGIQIFRIHRERVKSE